MRAPHAELVARVMHRFSLACAFVNIGFLDSKRFDAIPSDGDAETMWDAPNGFDFDTVLGERSRR